MTTHRSTSGTEIHIRPLADGDSIAELTDLLHRSYKRLADMGFRFLASHQSEEQTLERASDGECLVGISDGRLVATITFYPKPYNDGPLWYQRPDVGTFGQFAVEPSLQKSGIGSLLMDQVEEMARRHGRSELACDTAEGAAHLIAYYARRGYRFIEHTQWDVTNYRSVVLSKTLLPPAL